jgi:hypothetical protein
MSKLGRAPGTGELQVIFLSHTFWCEKSQF